MRGILIRMLVAVRNVLISVCFAASCLTSPLGAQTEPVRVRVDASRAPQHLIHSSMTMPVNAGPLTLRYPQWIPGDHQPVGPIADLVGLKITGGGRPIAWTRDSVDMFAFHLDVPAGVATLNIDLDLILAPEALGVDSSSSATQQLMVFYWSAVVLYPAGTPTDQLNYQGTLTVPNGWRYGTALPLERESGSTIEFKPSSLTTLADSPVLAGRNFQTIDLNPGGSVTEMIHIAADSAHATEASPELIASWRNLVKQEQAVFGAGHFRDYHFLLSLSDHGQPAAGLEHHESSDNRELEKGIETEGFIRFMGDLLPHEMAHSWNGKYRRPAGLATKDYSEPMKGDLLWVYEGLTDYYGRVFAARSGLRKPEDFLNELAQFAATYSAEAGRAWRPLEDTAVSAQNLYDSRDDYADLRRKVDYSNESTLIWLEADVLIRQLSKGAKSLDDFCRAFAAGPAGMPSVKPYDFGDVVATLNQVQPYDWAGFLNSRIRSVAPKPPLAGIENGGWKLAYTAQKTDFQKFREDYEKYADFMDSIGIKVKEDSTIADVRVTSRAYAAGVAPAVKLIAVNGRQYTPDVLHEALEAGKKTSEPLDLLVKDGEFYTTHHVDYHDGERYPRLERDTSKPDLLTEIAKPVK
jgi:predicted metalloprotease with PDZ domain